MTEDEWLTSADPDAMLFFLRDQPTGRRMRLFGVACCHQVRRYMTEPEVRDAVDVAERFADGAASPAELRKAGRKAAAVADGLAFEASVAIRMTEWAARDAAQAAAEVARGEKRFIPVRVMARARAAIAATPERPKDQAGLLRDIFGNPFRPPVVDPLWLTPTVLTLARGIYDDRAFDRLPILADALQDAGCEQADILTHCRDPKLVHVRGCWVVDRILGLP